MGILSLIIKREFLAKVKNKSFIIMTFISPLFFIAITALITFLSSYRSETEKIAIHDETGFFISEFKSNKNYHYTNASQKSIEELRADVKREVYDGALVIFKNEDLKSYEKRGIEYISESSPSLKFTKSIESKISKILTKKNRIKNGINMLKLNKSNINISLNLNKSSGEKTIKGLNEIKVFLGGAFGYFIMMFIIIYGNMVMRSVIEEKTNRIVEIIVSSVKPKQLMLGKIIGTTFAAMLQFLIWIIVGGVLYFALQLFLKAEVTAGDTEMAGLMQEAAVKGFDIHLYIKEILALPLFSIIVCFILYFSGGYFLYSSIYAAIGAAVDNETDSQQFIMPIITPLMLAVYIGFFTVVNEPHGTIAIVFSMIPLTSPIVMLMRIPFGVPLYQILISLALLVANFLLFVWVGAKIYRIGILMYGKKPSWRELVKWLKY